MNSESKGSGKLEVIAQQTFTAYPEMYKIVDFLNRTLKEKEIIFGLTKNKDGKMTISIYET
ncbi:MAG: YpmA family protein [Bacillota bacterium]